MEWKVIVRSAVDRIGRENLGARGGRPAVADHAISLACPTDSSGGMTRLGIERDGSWKKRRIDEAEGVTDRDLVAAARLAHVEARTGDGHAGCLCGGIALNGAGASAYRGIDRRAPRRRLNRELQRGLRPEQKPGFDDCKKKEQERRKDDSGLDGSSAIAGHR